MRDAMDSPVDLPGTEPIGGRSLGWTSLVIAVAALLLLATNAVSIGDWIDDMPPGPAQAELAAVADRWRATTDRIGLGAPRAWLHDRWRRAEAARFAGQR